MDSDDSNGDRRRDLFRAQVRIDGIYAKYEPPLEHSTIECARYCGPAEFFRKNPPGGLGL
jgi:hypothetical protein